MFKHLIVPLDGAPMSEAVLPAAGRLAEAAGARITLLHLLERKVRGTIHGERHLTEPEEAEAYLREAAARALPPGLEVERHVHDPRVGDVADGLVEHAAELKADLIVMCSHGRDRLREHLLGNLAQKVVSRRSTPVLYLRHSLARSLHFPFRKILVPLDGEGDHELGLGLAEDMARLCSASVLLATVVGTLSSLSGPQAAMGTFLPGATREMLNLKERQAAEYLGLLVSRLREDGLETAGRVCRGDPARLILRTVEEAGVDLVVLGTHGKKGADAFWEGSLSPKLIRRIEAWFLLAPVAE